MRKKLPDAFYDIKLALIQNQDLLLPDAEDLLEIPANKITELCNSAGYKGYRGLKIAIAKRNKYLSMPDGWTEAYNMGVETRRARRKNKSPFGSDNMMQWSAWWAGWNDCDRGLA